MSSTSITATWVTLRPWIWLCATSAEYFIAIINIIVWGSQNTCISQVLFCHTHSQRESSICGGVSCTYSDTSCLLISTFKAAQQPLFIFSAGVFRTNMMQACLFPCIVYNWSRECNGVYHFYSFSYQWQKQNSPSLCSFIIIIFFYLWWRRHYILASALWCVFLPTCIHMLASPNGSCSQPGPQEISQDAVEWHSVWLDLQVRGGGAAQLSSRFGWQTRCVLACCWKCDSPRPTWRTKKKKWSWYLPLPFCSFNVISGWVILALILCLCVMSY